MQYPLLVIHRLCLPCCLHDQRNVLIMACVLPINEKAVEGGCQNKAPHNPEDPARHTFTEEHYPDRCHQRRNVKGSGEHIGADLVAVIGFKVIEKGGYVVNACPHKGNVAAEKDRFHQSSYESGGPGVVLHCGCSFVYSLADYLFCLTVCSFV